MSIADMYPPGFGEAERLAALNAQTATANVRAAYARLRQIRDADPAAFASLTAAQRDQQLFDAVQDIAQAVIWLGRLLLGDTADGTD